MTAPHLHAEWQLLADTAAQIHAARVERDPARVERGELDAAEAERRERVARALMLQWRAVADRAEVPELPASHAELRAEIAVVAAEAAARAKVQPGNPAARSLADRVEALAWHQQPWTAGADQPLILFLHRCNQTARTLAAASDRTRQARVQPLPPRPAPLRAPSEQQRLFG